MAKGIDRITWTFDPLQSRNAYLNFAKLGVKADRYKVNYYGETSSFLHSIGTDRLWVTWELESDRVRQRLEGFSGNSLPATEVDRATILLRHGESKEPILRNDSPSENGAVIEIPLDINALIANDIGLAVRWREATRHVFPSLLDEGYYVEQFDLDKVRT